MRLLRPILLAVIFAGAFYYFTTYRSGAMHSANWFGRPLPKVEITEAATGESFDAEEQNNIGVYRKNIDSVVNITSRAVTFDFFYGLVPQEGQGSGFIIDKEGHVLTNYHVIAEARQVEVTLHNLKKYKATVVGTDRAHDLAVIQIKGPGLNPMVLGDSHNLQVGQKVYAIGNPFGLAGTMTRGIISSIRPVREPDGLQIDEAIQTDAAINPGNSGGPLADMAGRVIGVNVATSSGGTNVSFSIPSDLAQIVSLDLINHRTVDHPYLGVGFITPLDAAEQGLAFTGPGIEVTTVASGTPAASAGLQRNDVIVAVDGQTLDSNHSLGSTITRHKVGDALALTVHRGADTLTLSPVLSQRPGA